MGIGTLPTVQYSCSLYLPKRTNSTLLKFAPFGSVILSQEHERHKTYKYWFQIQLLASALFIRVADPVHFRPDPAPDPANQNFKNRLRDPSGTYQESIQTSKFFSHQTQCVKPLFIKYFFLVYRYNFTLPKY